MKFCVIFSLFILYPGDKKKKKVKKWLGKGRKCPQVPPIPHRPSTSEPTAMGILITP